MSVLFLRRRLACFQFISTKTHGTRDPWVLTGDFNIVRESCKHSVISAISCTVCVLKVRMWVIPGPWVQDAIASTNERSGEFGFVFQPPREQSDAYEWLMKILSPRGDLINLMYETQVTTHAYPIEPCTVW